MKRKKLAKFKFDTLEPKYLGMLDGSKGAYFARIKKRGRTHYFLLFLLK